MNTPAIPQVTTNAIEAVIRAAWESALSVGPIGPHDDFIQLGGDSLAAAHICLSLCDDLGMDVPVVALFDYPTIASLAAYLQPSLLTSDPTS